MLAVLSAYPFQLLTPSDCKEGAAHAACARYLENLDSIRVILVAVFQRRVTLVNIPAMTALATFGASTNSRRCAAAKSTSKSVRAVRL